jgi:transcriptional regulator with XRE-family HTH domain
MDAMGWSQAELARRAKTTRQNVTNWMTGVSLVVDSKFAFAIQDESRFNARWIIHGEGAPRMEPSDPHDTKLLAAIAKLTPERKRALALALDLPL